MKEKVTLNKIKKYFLFFCSKQVLIKSVATFLIFWSAVFVFTNVVCAPIFASIPMRLTSCQQWNTCYGKVFSAIVQNQLNENIINDINLETNADISLSNNNFLKSDYLCNEGHWNIIVDEKGVPKHRISAYCIKNKKKTNKWIVMTHGIACDWTYSFLFALSFFENYNVILYDSYGVDSGVKDCFSHLGSTGGYSTFGKYEKYGLHAIINKIYSEDQNAEVGLFGLSMGASTTLLYLEDFHDQSSNIVKFAISDAAYKDAAEEMGNVAKSFIDVPPLFFIPGGSLYLSFFAGYNPYEINIIKNINKIDNSKKIFFIQGSKDNFVPFKDNFYQLINECKKNNITTGEFVETGGFHGDDLKWNRSTIDAKDSALSGIFYEKLNYFAREGF